MRNITQANTGVFIKKHSEATLVLDNSGNYRLYASVNKRRPSVYHVKSQALTNYRRAIRLASTDKHCNCNKCQSQDMSYSVRVLTSTARQAGNVAYVRQAQY